MGKRPGAKYAAVQRLDGLMADGVKRSVAKDEARARGESLFAFTDGRIHAFESRANYQKIVMRFINWCRDHYDLHNLAHWHSSSGKSGSELHSCCQSHCCGHAGNFDRSRQHAEQWAVRLDTDRE